VACYGRNLATGRLVEPAKRRCNRGQSIGEPGTQLTMRRSTLAERRTYSEQSTQDAKSDGLPVLNYVSRRAQQGRRTDAMNRNGKIVVVDEKAVRRNGTTSLWREVLWKTRPGPDQPDPARMGSYTFSDPDGSQRTVHFKTAGRHHHAGAGWTKSPHVAAVVWIAR